MDIFIMILVCFVIALYVALAISSSTIDYPTDHFIMKGDDEDEFNN